MAGDVGVAGKAGGLLCGGSLVPLPQPSGGRRRGTDSALARDTQPRQPKPTHPDTWDRTRAAKPEQSHVSYVGTDG